MKYSSVNKVCLYQPTITISNEFVPDIKLWRQPDYIDIPKIRKLFCPATLKLFGEVSMEELIELSTVSIVMENTLNEIIAYISLKTYPNIYSLDPAVWIDWMQYHFGLNEIKYNNTYFIHLLVWDVRYNFEFFSHLLQSIFLNNCQLQFICLLSLPGSPTSVYMGDQLFRQYFTRISPWGIDETIHAQKLFICSRLEQILQMKIRRAVVEDNDELVQILDKSSPILRELYGDYYIAEMILSANKHRTIIVAENENVVIGMLCLNSDLNIKILNQHFELGPFHGLIKHTVEETIPVSSIARNLCNGKLHTKRFNSAQCSDRNFFMNVSYAADYSIQKSDLIVSESESESLSYISEKESLEEILLRALKSSSSDSLSDVTSSRTFIQSLNNFNSGPKQNDSKVTIFTEKYDLGDINAYAIELFGLRNEIDDRLIYRLLIRGFETFDDRDYCIIVLPTIYKTFPLLQHFVKVVPRPDTTINHNLFVMHRNSVLSKVSVRLIDYEDIEKLTIFFNEVLHNQYIMDLIKDTLIKDQHISLQSYVLLNGNDIVGATVLKEYHHYYYLKTNYDLDFHINYKNHKHCEIQIFYLSPIFNNNLFFIFNEIHRLTGYTSFYYFLYDDLINQPNLVTIISELIPIRPRRRIIYNEDTILLNYVQSDKLQKDIKLRKIFSLYHTNIRELNYVNKIMINTRIVVVGMSTTGLAFIEELIYNKLSQKCIFPNIILVTTRKYNAKKSINKHITSKLVPKNNKYSFIYLKKINLKVWVNIINGFLTEIDRYKKIIVINNKSVIKYDYLFLFCGLKYDLPPCIKSTTDAFVPSNIFIINNLNDGDAMYHKVKPRLNDIGTKIIIVYGESLESYCCINFLLFIGIKPINILFIKPPYSQEKEFSVPVFNDTFVQNKMVESLKALNIKTLENHKLLNWQLNENLEAIKIIFETEYLKKSIDCSYCIIYDVKIVNVRTLKAINHAGLVFDGRLVIDSDFQTSDPFIYAAGSLTKYRRVLYADQYRHQYYNSEEIGIELAKSFIEKLDPTVPYNHKKPPKDFSLCVPQYKKPIVISCQLPGKYNYLYISAPGLPVPHTAAKVLSDYGIDLITGDPSIQIKQEKNINANDDETEKIFKYTKRECEEFGYFRLHLNQYNFVQTIVCLTKKKIEITNIIEIWGKHEKLLFNLLSQFTMNLIYDFFEYFRGMWAYALYHDRFNLMTELNKKIIYNDATADNEDQYLLNNVKQYIINNKWEKLTEFQRQDFIAEYTSSKYQKIVENNLLIFLKEYADELPMYTHPENIENLLN